MRHTSKGGATSRRLLSLLAVTALAFSGMSTAASADVVDEEQVTPAVDAPVTPLDAQNDDGEAAVDEELPADDAAADDDTAGTTVDADVTPQQLAEDGPTLLAAPSDPSTGNGLLAEYFRLKNGSGQPIEFADTPVASVIEPTIFSTNLHPAYNFRIGEGQTNREYVGIRWTGYFTAPETGNYTFHSVGDDGFRMWLGDNPDPIINFWRFEWEVPHNSGPIALEEGESYPIVFESVQGHGGANIRLTVNGPGLDGVALPTELLSPPAALDATPVSATVATNGDAVVLTYADTPAGDVTADMFRVATAEMESASEYFVPTGVVVDADTNTVTISLNETVKKNMLADVIYSGEALTVGDLPASDVRVQTVNLSRFGMRTPWADEVSFDVQPLQEYPRPQLERGNWVNLNGVWEFAALQGNAAPVFGETLAEEVLVPFPIESDLSGIARHEDNMQYRTVIDFDHANSGIALGNKVLLHFGAVDYDTVVYVNGEEVGTHRGGYDPFNFDITGELVQGENEIVVRVADYTGPGQVRGKQIPNPGGIFYTPSSGIWQTVWMETVPNNHIEKLDITPDFDNDQFIFNAVSSSGTGTVEVTVRDAGGAVVGTGSGAAGADIAVTIADPIHWSPDNPYLYDVEASLSGVTSSDSVKSYAGMRKIHIEEVDGVPRIFLNDEQTFLLSTLDQGYWPDGIVTAPTDEALAWDIQVTKDLGFNTIRKHIKVEPARWYYHADTIGMLVWQDGVSMGNAHGGGQNGNDNRPTNVTPAEAAQFETELYAMIDALYSSPAIIGWIPFNEGWGEWSRAATGRIADEVKEYDPTRIVNAHSGYNCCDSRGDSGRGDIKDWHAYPGPARPGLDQYGRAVIDGEHGGASLAIRGHMWPGAGFNPYGQVSSMEALTAAYVSNNATLLRLADGYMSGSVYTQITDVETEVNGFYTYDRKVLKMDLGRVKAINERIIEVGSGVRPEPQPNAVVGHYPFDENQGDTSANVLGDAGDQELSDGASWTEGRDGSALRVYGNNNSYSEATVDDFDTS